MTSKDREAILARRRYFVASALAGFTLAACEKTAPEPCLKVATTPTPTTEQAPPVESVETPPEPCLEIAAPLVDAGPQQAVDAAEPSRSDASTAVKPPPTPVPTAPRPRPCLKIAIPKKDRM